jgi:hypothetical protein
MNSLHHFQTVTEVPLANGPVSGGLSAWSEDNVIAECSQKVILMHHARCLTDRQMIAHVDSAEGDVHLTERKDSQAAAFSSLALVNLINKRYCALNLAPERCRTR